MTKFLYRLDDESFRLPWGETDMNRLRLWYIDLHQKMGGLGRFTIYLFGGKWSSNSNSWDADLFLVTSSGEIDMDNKDELRQAYRIIWTGYQLALNEHRFLIDFTFCNRQRLHYVYRQIKKFEAETESDLHSTPGKLPVMGIFKRIHKTRDGVVECEFEKRQDDVIDLGDNRYLYQKPHQAVLKKQMRLIRSGRVYHQPTPLKDLIS